MKKLFVKTPRYAVSAQAEKQLKEAAVMPTEELFAKLGTGANGHSEETLSRAREIYGENIVSARRKTNAFMRLLSAFANPFTAVLAALAIVSVFTDIIFSDEKNYVTVCVIAVMVGVSGLLRFFQETRSETNAKKLADMIHTTATVVRDGVASEAEMSEIAVGDVVCLSAGDMLPADVRILSAKDLFVSQSALTGESEPVEKAPVCACAEVGITDMTNLAFTGSNVVSGSARGVVVATGRNTVMGGIADRLNKGRVKTEFDRGVSSVSRLLIGFMLVMVPVVFLINGLTKGDWLQGGLFAVSVAVGLTPEMLPMIVTTSLAKGAVAMSRKRVVIKSLDSVQNLGGMDILCTDKTGTLTQDKVILEMHLDTDGKENERVLRHAFLNSYFQTGLKNLIDVAVIEKQREYGADDLIARYMKTDEIPFDFERRRMSVAVTDSNGKTQMVTKGALEEVLDCCAFTERNGNVVPLDGKVKERVMRRAEDLNAEGMRVIAVAQKNIPAFNGQLTVADESVMVLIGFLALLDPPKDTARTSIKALKNHGVTVKVLTGDNEKVTACICRKVGLDAERVLLGADVEAMTDEELTARAETTDVFAKLSPSQKARVVAALRAGGHCVGYMGDGINDAPAMKAADVAVSVDTAVDIAKESASVVMLEKDLNVHERAVEEGRKTYANMIKYIKITASSNFGNMFSVLVASACLPFLPMKALHLIVLNLVYDISCIALPWDNVDAEYIKNPRKWNARGIGGFMLCMGPISSLFDIATYLIMFFVVCPAVCGAHFSELTDPAGIAKFIALFQTGWFVESMWTQTLVVHALRTSELPFVRSRASLPVCMSSLAAIAFVTALPYSPIAEALSLAALPGVYFFAFLAAVIFAYLLLCTLAKKLYMKATKEFL